MRPDLNPPRPRPHTSPDDRRDTPRFKVETRVDLETESNFYGGFTFDLSTGGVFVTMFDALPEVGTRVELSFELPGSARLSVTAVVRWKREANHARQGLVPGVGLQFLELPQSAREAIERFVRGREPMFYDG